MEFHPLVTTGHALPKPIFLFGPVGRAALKHVFGQAQGQSAGYYRVHDAVLTGDGLVSAGSVASSDRPALPGQGKPSRKADGPTVLFDERLDTSARDWFLEIPYRIRLLHRCSLDVRSLSVLSSPQLAPVVGDALSHFGVGQPHIRTYGAADMPLVIGDLILPTGLDAGCGAGPIRSGPAPAPLTLAAGAAPGAGGTVRAFVACGPQAPLRNAPELAEIAEQRGYTTLNLSGHVTADCARVLAGAAAIVTCGEQGSWPSLFCKPGAVVCSLHEAGRLTGTTQLSVAQVLDHPVGYVFGIGDSTGTQAGFRVDPDDFEIALKVAEFYVAA